MVLTRVGAPTARRLPVLRMASSGEKPNFLGEDLRKRQFLSGLSVEDLELILHPMAEE
mgnify:CR=1 FL=1